MFLLGYFVVIVLKKEIEIAKYLSHLARPSHAAMPLLVSTVRKPFGQRILLTFLSY
jgi:hypothetical protein